MDATDRPDVKLRAKRAYEDQAEIWPEDDAWSTHTRRAISGIVGNYINESCRIALNAGCGNNDYGLSERTTCVNLDISKHQCRKVQHAVVADIEALPFRNGYFDATVCVGAVLNYTEPYEAIPELLRVTKPSGLLLLDVETTNTAELLLTKDWAKRVSVVERTYAGRSDKTFLFSVRHIQMLLKDLGAELTVVHHYHTTTAMWQRAFPRWRLPTIALAADKYASRIPGLNRIASNAIFVCQKR
jgi:SAM-dependent methyltransferase